MLIINVLDEVIIYEALLIFNFEVDDR